MPTPIQRDAYVDVPLSGVLVQAFQDDQNFIANEIFPPLPVDSETGRYWTIQPHSWLTVSDDKRSRKAAPSAVEFDVSSDAYVCDNYALRTDNAIEDLAQADKQMRLRETSARLLASKLKLGQELRIANIVTSGANCGSYVALSAGAKWSNYVSSDPIADVTTAHAFIANQTGLAPNIAVIDKDTLAVVRRHPVLLDLYKYVSGGQLNDSQIAEVLGVPRVVVGRAVYNRGNVGQSTRSMANVWGNNVLFAHVQAGLSAKTMTYGGALRWTPAGMPGPMQSFVYPDADIGTHKEWTECGYYQDEKIIAQQLSYLISSTL